MINQGSILIKFSLIHNKYIINKIIKNNINIINSYEKNKFIYIELSINDYEKLKVLDYKKVIQVVSYKGIINLKYILKNSIEKIIVSLIIIILLYLSNFLIININIHTSDKNLKNLINYYLIDNKINSFSIKKGYNKLNIIKEKILDKYRDKIEWIEIVNKGYSYDVYVIKRKQNRFNIDNNRCHYIARKSGTITSIVAQKGVLLVQENNYVSAGDILISGDIIYNDELKKEVCATGVIKGEVWYKVNVSYPLVINKKVKNNNVHYNFNLIIFNKKFKILNSKYNEEKEVKKIGNKSLGIIVSKSWNNKYKKVTYTEKEAANKALNIAKNKLLIKLPKNSQIISQNILKKYINNGKIYIEVLLTAEEEIGVVENY